MTRRPQHFAPVGANRIGMTPTNKDESMGEVKLTGPRVLVCGGRDYTDGVTIYRVLTALHNVNPIDTIIHGGADGADSIGGFWAKSHGVGVEVFRADWGRDGKAAGPIRNQRMLDVGKPDFVVAFPGGRGTADMVRRANAAKITVINVSGAADTPSGRALLKENGDG